MIKWVKITTDMFDNRKIKAIRELPEGNNIILIWVMILSLAGKCNAGGLIHLTENIPYTNKMLADELRFPESVICMALETLERFGMLRRNEALEIIVKNWDEYQSGDEQARIREYERERKAEQREKKSLALIPQKKKKAEEEDPSAVFRPSKNNVENVNRMIDALDDYSIIRENEKLKNGIIEWMAYKDERKPKTSNHYSSERGMKSFLNNAVKYEKLYGTDAVLRIISESIASNYQGVAWGQCERNHGGKYMDKIENRVSEVDNW